MNKNIFLGIALCCSMSTVSAQEVYNKIRSMAKASIEASQPNDMVRQLNQFKLDALDYMGMKMKEQMPDSSVTMLDKQAYALYEFINIYIKGILLNSELSKSGQIKGIRLFMDASYSNPLFNDTDAELTLSYYANSASITRFSLDTDWRKALAAIKAESKKQ